MALYEEFMRMLMFLDRLTPAGRLLPMQSVGRQYWSVIIRSQHSGQPARDYWVVVSVLASLSSPQLVCYHNAEGSLLGSNRLWAFCSFVNTTRVP